MDDPFANATRRTAGELGLAGTAPVELSGTLPPAPRLAVVGSRAARTERAQAVVGMVAAAQRTGRSIVSGGALGIDTAVHRAALRLGVPQVAVLPCGPDQPYPPANIGLFRDIIAAGGAVLFGRPRGAVTNRGVFASRNRIVVELAECVAVAQASLRSGSLSTGQLALRLGRRVAVLDGQASAATLATAGACVLTRWHDAEALTAGTQRFIAGQRPGRAVWPEELLALRAAIEAAGPTGLGVDGLGPALTLMLVRAEAEGFVGPRCAGRYVALR